MAAPLNVRAVETLDVALIEHRRHRLDRFELAADLLELRRLQHAGGLGGSVGIVLEDVPAAEDDVVEVGERNELVDFWRAGLGALAEANGAHLGERTDRQRESLADREHAGNRRCRDGAKADEQHAKLAARRRYLNW